MVALRSRARTLETPSNPKHSHDENPSKVSKNDDASGYEQSRDERIKQNLERMQKLGIFDLSTKLKSNKSPKRIRRINTNSPLPSSLPTRRSSRLQSVTPVSYLEVSESKKGKELGSKEISIREGLKPEIYSEEHEKLLGSCEETWVLFVDGFGADGKRIYDPVNGKTCHQCRQKTLGHRTHCSNCNMVQGQFCGDCLYMRYGENVLEAEKNPDWICPVCRGICNCSLCRLKRGWAPTGMLYKKVVSHGYKSVAHYLIQTRRSLENSDALVSAKRSLPFTDAEETSLQKGSVESDGDECDRGVKPEESKNISDDRFNGEKEHKSLDTMDVDVNSKFTVETKPRTNGEKEQKSLDTKPCTKNISDDGFNGEKEQKSLDTMDVKSKFTVETKSSTDGEKEQQNSNKMDVDLKFTAGKKPSTDCIAGRLRKREAQQLLK